LAPLRAELLPALPARGAAGRGGRQHDLAHRLSLRRPTVGHRPWYSLRQVRRSANGGHRGQRRREVQVFMRRRRPLAAAAMVGGASYLGARAGQNAAMNKANEQAMEDDQSARIAQLEQQQYMQQQAAPAAAPAAPAQSEMTSKLMELKNLH